MVLGWMGSCAAMAAPPQINNIAPLGAQRGVSAEVTISGSNLSGNPRLIAPFAFTLLAPTAGDASSSKLRLTIAPDTAVGVYPVRVQTDDGISNPFLFAVGQLPQVAEKEENSIFESAQSIPDPPLVVEGQVAGNDVDFFKFRGKKGQRIVIDAQCARIGSGIDPTIRLTTAAATRTFIASADDTPGLLTDARLTAELPEDTEYVVEISDSRYQGAARPVYRLLIGAVPMAEEIYPLGGRAGETLGIELRGGTLSGTRTAALTLTPLEGTELVPPRITSATLGADTRGAPVFDVESLGPLVVSPYLEVREPSDPTATPVRAVAPVVFNGRIDPAGDEDQFVLVAVPGQKFRIKVQASELGSALDGVLQVRGNGGSVVANADDTNIRLPGRNQQQAQVLVLPDPSLELTIPAGTNEVTLAIRDLENRGGIGFPYRVRVEPVVPDFELMLNDAQVSVPRNGAALVGVTVRRIGYDGPITLGVTGPPTGLSARPGTIPAGQTAGLLSLSAAPDASFPAAAIKLVGRGGGSTAPIERLAIKPVVFAQQANFPMNTLIQHGLVTALAMPDPVALVTPSETVEVPRGFGGTVPITVVRPKGADGALAISALSLPPGVTLANTTIAEKSNQGSVKVNAALQAAIGTITLGLQAKGKFSGSERTVALPGVTLSVVHPVALALDAPTVEFKPSSTFELKGKVIRRGTFDGPVTVKINSLPIGVRSEPVTVAGKASSFVLKVVADAKAASGTTATQAALSFQVDKKDYSFPAAPLVVKVAK
jgi:hypothetical protein